eukprot:GHVQ01012404.1.p1 GENE.GHVQ01012404.1~~GHVQ01012404.1.p1  ORF type:complete len:187 (+),score=22.61 GHVQ01012404.1:366-926(+)
MHIVEKKKTMKCLERRKSSVEQMESYSDNDATRGDTAGVNVPGSPTVTADSLQGELRINETMGAAPRISRPKQVYTQMYEIAAGAKRFSEPPSKATEATQLENKDKWMTRAKFPVFEASNEQQLEDYLDAISRIQKTYRLSVVLVKELWEAASKCAIASVIAGTEAADYESIGDEVAWSRGQVEYK